MYIRDLKKLAKEIENQKIYIKEQNEKLQEMKIHLQESCHHPKQYVVTDEYYSSGTYLDTDYTEYTPRCEICNLTGEKKTVNHGNYG